MNRITICLLAAACLTITACHKKEDASLYLNSCVDKIGSGNIAGAIADCTKAIEVDPKMSAAYVNRSYARLGIRNFDGAIADATEAIQMGDMSGYSARGQAKQLSGDLSGAIEDITKAIELQPTAIAYELRAKFRYEKESGRVDADKGQMAGVSKGELALVVTDCTKAVTMDSGLADAYATCGFAKKLLGDDGGAITDFSQAIVLKPQNAVPYMGRCGVELAVRNFPQSVADCTKAIALKPDYEDAYAIRGLARASTGDLDGGIADYDTVIQLEPASGPAYSTRGDIKKVKGDIAGANADYAKATALGFDGFR